MTEYRKTWLKDLGGIVTALAAVISFAVWAFGQAENIHDIGAGLRIVVERVEKIEARQAQVDQDRVAKFVQLNTALAAVQQRQIDNAETIAAIRDDVRSIARQVGVKP